MPAFVAMILGGLLSVAGSMVGRVLIALGIGVATYSGVSATLSSLKGSAFAAMLSLPANVVGMLGTMKTGESINIIFSALVARLVLNGLTSDTVKKWVIK